MRHAALRITIACALLLVILAVGWLLLSSMGRELLRQDLERRLSDLLQGTVRISELRFELQSGLAVRGLDVSVYPSEEGRPGLYGREVYAELNEAALLMADFQLAELAIDDLQVELAIDQAGAWEFRPLRQLQERSDRAPVDPDTRILLGAVDAVARALMRSHPIAEVVSIRGGVVRFEDRNLAGPGAPGRPEATEPPVALEVRLEGIRAELSRPWRSGEAAIRLSGTLIEPSGNAVPVAIRGTGYRDGRSRISLAVEGLDLDVLDRYTARLGAEADLDGILSGTLGFESSVGADLRTHKALDVDFTLDGIASRLTAGGRQIELPLPISKLRLRLEVDPETVRLIDLEALGDRVRIGIDAAIERPVSADAPTRLSAELSGAQLDDVGPIIEQLPAEARQSLDTWFEPMESGDFERLGIAGTAPFSEWLALARGELASLPEDFLLSFRVSNVTAQLGEQSAIENLGFAAAWTEEQLEISEARGDWQGEALPVVDVTITGLERFLKLERSAAVSEPPEIDGAGYLWELVSQAGARAANTEKSDPRKLELDVTWANHPLIGWPLERARVSVSPISNGTQIAVSGGFWGGIPIHAEALYLETPERRFSIRLNADPDLPARPSAETDRDAREWASGAFLLAPVEHDPTPAAGVLSTISGDFSLRGGRLTFGDVHVAVGPQASARIELALELGTADEIGVSLDAHLEDARVEGIIDAVGLPPDFVTGTARLDAAIGGAIRRSDDPFAGLDGTVSFKARDGEIRQEVPMVVALATATDGFNPFSSMSAMQYESIDGTLTIQNGMVRVDRFELEGPIRVYATGSLDYGPPPWAVEGVVGVFLFQRTRALLDMVPLVNLVVPGSSKGMVGAYFSLDGSWEDPEVSTMKMKSLQEQLPDILTKPFELLHSLWAPAPQAPADVPSGGG